VYQGRDENRYIQYSQKELVYEGILVQVTEGEA
jgi:hypothetical protein